MDLNSLIEGAIKLGVIPVLALFLVVAMHRQNRKLIEMLDSHEKQTWEMLKALVQEITIFSKNQIERMSESDDDINKV